MTTLSVLLVAALVGCGDTSAPPLPMHEPPADPAATPAAVTPVEPRQNAFWWPQTVNLAPLRDNADASPYGADYDYPAEFAKLDLEAVKADIRGVLTTSQAWWPADYGNYGPLFIRLAWHSSGTYRAIDGRGGADGGQIRFEPLNSWPDNANLDKARRLLLPVKAKYGQQISWSDLMVLTGTVAMESMGFDTLGFAGGRTDDFEADLVYWGPEQKMLADTRFHGERDLQDPLAAAQMGLIYVNPEGPNGNPDPHAAIGDIRATFGRMGMDDEETVALIAGGHTFGKAHGAHAPKDCVDAEPAAQGVASQGTGWHNKCGAGNGVDTVTSGLEGAWTSSPAKWTREYFAHLFTFEWEKGKSPAGATQWHPAGGKGEGLVPDAHDPAKRHQPMMFTTDLSMREGDYAAISKRFHEDPAAFEVAFAKAWFKLTHRDLGPRTRYLGADVPAEVFSWQDPLDPVDHALVTAADQTALKARILASGVAGPELVRVAWAAASTYRDSDMRGGANGARIRLAPQKDWAVNDPAEVAKVMGALDTVKQAFEAGGKRVSVADLLVLGAGAAIEKAASDAGLSVTVPFRPGRADATVEQTDPVSFGYLEPKADGFRNYRSDTAWLAPVDGLIDRADLLDLTVPEMTALVGGLRVLGANAGASPHGVLTTRPGALSNDFFVNLLDLETRWQPAAAGTFEGRGPDGAVRWTATEVDLVFGSSSELRAVSEVYAFDQQRFAADFVDAWVKVMEADRFDLHR